MKLNWMTSAILTVGACAAAPVMAGEYHHFDRPALDVQIHAVPVDHWREHREIIVADAPPPVIATAERFGNGRHIDSIGFVPGPNFYVVHMSRFHKQPIDLRIDQAGGLIAIDRY